MLTGLTLSSRPAKILEETPSLASADLLSRGVKPTVLRVLTVLRREALQLHRDLLELLPGCGQRSVDSVNLIKTCTQKRHLSGA